MRRDNVFFNMVDFVNADIYPYLNDEEISIKPKFIYIILLKRYINKFYKVIINFFNGITILPISILYDFVELYDNTIDDANNNYKENNKYNDTKIISITKFRKEDKLCVNITLIHDYMKLRVLLEDKSILVLLQEEVETKDDIDSHKTITLENIYENGIKNNNDFSDKVINIISNNIINYLRVYLHKDSLRR